MTWQPPEFTVSELAKRLGGELRGEGTRRIRGINSLADAGPDDISFVADSRHARDCGLSRAAALVLSRRFASQSTNASCPMIIVDDAEIASISLLNLFAPPPPRPEAGAHVSAVVHSSARLGVDARIGPHVSVDRECTIGDRVILHSGVRLYPGVTIGDDSELHANVVVRERCRIGAKCILHQNVSIGADGFGYRPNPLGQELLKVTHVGIVIIEDAVEIGANSCVDRAKFGATVIGAGTKIDNLVQIGHNCRVGRMCVIAGQTGLSGSVEVGDGVQIGGQVGIADHVKVGCGAQIGAQAGVMGDIPAGESYLGTPAMPGRETLRVFAAQRKLPDLLRRVSRQFPANDR